MLSTPFNNMGKRYFLAFSRVTSEEEEESEPEEEEEPVSADNEKTAIVVDVEDENDEA